MTLPQRRQGTCADVHHVRGGFTALYYAALYPPLSPPSQGGPDPTKLTEIELDSVRPNIAGIACAAPMLAISPHCEQEPSRGT